LDDGPESAAEAVQDRIASGMSLVGWGNLLFVRRGSDRHREAAAPLRRRAVACLAGLRTVRSRGLHPRLQAETGALAFLPRLADRDLYGPVSRFDRHDLPGLIDELVPGGAAVVDDVVEGF